MELTVLQENFIEKDNKMRRLSHWKRLRDCRNEFFNDNTDATLDNGNNAFYYHLQHKYGIKLSFDNSGNITESYDVVDEKKYFFFLLKYTD